MRELIGAWVAIAERREEEIDILGGVIVVDLLKNNKVLFFGDGAEKCREVLGNNPNAHFLPGFTNSATHLTKKAAEKFIQKDFEDVAYFEPFYLKDFIAGKKKA